MKSYSKHDSIKCTVSRYLAGEITLATFDKYRNAIKAGKSESEQSAIDAAIDAEIDLQVSELA